MTKDTLPAGTVHTTAPDFLQKALFEAPAALAAWHDITPLARNEWICLATSAKQKQTTERRLKRTIDQLSRGQRRPCCWEGCPHRAKNGK
ncbi:MAG: YdeI/OmpD-associated family protein [Candidatus Saccharimonas sp.]